jgi:hypothetical protein
MGVVAAAFVFPAFSYPAGNTAGPCHYGARTGVPLARIRYEFFGPADELLAA